MENSEYEEVPDIWDNLKRFKFTDGCGTMSLQLAEEISSKINLPYIASAFQIRFNGCKGVIVSDATMENHKLRFRSSMKKFECPSTAPQYNKVEVCSPAAYIPCFLNRNIIQVLEHARIPSKVFLQLQQEMVKKKKKKILTIVD